MKIELIIFISVIIGLLPALAIYKIWKWFVYYAFTVPKLIQDLIDLSFALAHFATSIKMASEKWRAAMSKLPSGGIVHGPTIDNQL